MAEDYIISEHAAFVAKAIARRRWQDESRWREVILEGEEFVACYFATRAWSGGTRYSPSMIAIPGTATITTTEPERLAAMADEQSTPVPDQIARHPCCGAPIGMWHQEDCPHRNENSAQTTGSPGGEPGGMCNSMVERVARAIFPEAWEPIRVAERSGVIGRQLSGEAIWKLRERANSVDRACAAIAAMREPTEAMVRAGNKRQLIGFHISGGAPPQPPKLVWADMIDAALGG